MTSVTPMETPTQSPTSAACRLQWQLLASEQAGKITADLQAADTALGRQDSDLVRPTAYRELAEEAIGQLVPTARAVAEHAAAKALAAEIAGIDISTVSREHGNEIALIAFRRAFHAYRETLGGRRHDVGRARHVAPLPPTAPPDRGRVLRGAW